MSEPNDQVTERSSNAAVDEPPPLRAAALQLTAAGLTTLGGLIAILLGCLLLAIKVLTYLGLLLLVVTLILILKARGSIVQYSHRAAVDEPPP